VKRLLRHAAIASRQACEANFHSGELVLLNGSQQEAVSLFAAAASTCAHGLTEWAAANAELKELGAAPQQAK
jgi:lipoprotein NlpI